MKVNIITTADYNKFTKNIVANRIRSEKLINKPAIAEFINNPDLKTESGLKTKQDKITKLKTFDSNYFRGKSHFEDDGTQNYSVFQPMYRYFKKIGNTEHISAWKSIGLFDESI